MSAISTRLIYDAWYENNRKLILTEQWRLVDKGILEHPETDRLRGLNLIFYLSPKINKIIEAMLLPKLTSVIGENQWIISAPNRHITVLDIIPHNSNPSLLTDEKLPVRYAEVIQSIILSFKEPLEVEFSGIIVSPDGITVQGFPSKGVSLFRNLLRKNFELHGLKNFETSKYVNETAHAALVKFITPLSGRKLLDIVDTLRDCYLGSQIVSELFLTISPRYDKTTTKEIIRQYTLG